MVDVKDIMLGNFVKDKNGEIVHYDYDKFECVVLAEDGTYHKASLGQVKVIKEE